MAELKRIGNDYYMCDDAPEGKILLETQADLFDWAGRMVAKYDCENDVASQIGEEIIRTALRFYANA